MKKIIIFAFTVVLFSQENKVSLYLDKYHNTISCFIIDGSDSIDRFLTKSNDCKRLSKTRIKVAYEFGAFANGKTTNDYDFSLYLSLPRFQKKASLTFEKVNETTSLFEDKKEDFLSKQGDNLEDSYNLALKYNKWRGKKSNISLTGGVRFSKIFLEPYLGLIGRYNIAENNKTKFNINNTLRFYIAGEIKDSFNLQYLYKYDKNVLLGWRGNISYSNKESNQYLTSEFIRHEYINDYKFIRFGFLSTATLTHFKNPKSESFEIYSKYHNKMLGKDWLFYEVTPAIKADREDDFKPSVGIKFKIGATFGDI